MLRETVSGSPITVVRRAVQGRPPGRGVSRPWARLGRREPDWQREEPGLRPAHEECGTVSSVGRKNPGAIWDRTRGEGQAAGVGTSVVLRMGTAEGPNQDPGCAGGLQRWVRNCGRERGCQTCSSLPGETIHRACSNLIPSLHC